MDASLQRALRLACLASILVGPSVPAEDCNFNGVDDVEDIRRGSSRDCDADETPDECQADFQGARFIALADASAVQVGDFTGDGVHDLLAVVQPSSDVDTAELALLRGLGGGDFAPTVTRSVAVIFGHRALSGDVDGDGDLDLVLESSAGRRNDLPEHGFSVFLNRGDGEFAPPAYYPRPLPRSRLADLDGDGDVDLITPSDIFFSEGDGVFARPRVLEWGTSWNQITSGDIDGDGDIDLAAADTRHLVLYFNDGSGTFERRAEFRIPNWLVSLSLADVDGDGDTDIAASVYARQLALLAYNGGDGQFGPLVELSLPYYVSRLHPIDMNGDGRPELVTGNMQDDECPAFATVSVHFADGLSPLGEEAIYALGSLVSDTSSDAVLEDLDQDGDVDFVHVGESRGGIQILVNDGRGGLSAMRHFVRSTFQDPGVSTAELDGDGRDDLIVVLPGDDRIVVLSDYEGESFESVLELDVGASPWQATTADLDGDGDADIAATMRFALSLWFNDGQAGFGESRRIPIASNPWRVAAGDWDRDGDVDLVTVNRFTGDRGADNFSILINRGGAEFSSVRNFFLPVEPADLEAADMNGDGDIDLIMSGIGYRGLIILDGRGDGSFSEARPIELPEWHNDFTPADFDGDGDLDLILLYNAEDDLLVLRNLGEGRFEAPELSRSYTSGIPFGQALLAADLNGDGETDLAVAGGLEGSLSVVFNHGEAHRVARFTAGVHPEALAAPDLDGDGDLDLATGNRGPNGAVSVLLNTTPRRRDGDAACGPAARFRRGDVEPDGRRDLSDAIRLLAHLFLGTAELPCPDAADTNDDGVLDVTDPVFLLRHLFLGAGPLPEPFAECGPDPDPDALECRQSSC